MKKKNLAIYLMILLLILVGGVFCTYRKGNIEDKDGFVYYDPEIKTFLQTKCGNCHFGSGAQFPDLSFYDNVKLHSTLINSALTGSMSGYASDYERELFKKWIDEGMLRDKNSVISFSREVIPALVRSCSNGKAAGNYDTTVSPPSPILGDTVGLSFTGCHNPNSTRTFKFVNGKGDASSIDYNQIKLAIENVNVANQLKTKLNVGSNHRAARMYYVGGTINSLWNPPSYKVADTVANPTNVANPITVDAIAIQWIDQGYPNN